MDFPRVNGLSRVNERWAGPDPGRDRGAGVGGGQGRVPPGPRPHLTSSVDTGVLQKSTPNKFVDVFLIIS